MNRLISQLQRLYLLPAQPGSIRPTGQGSARETAALTAEDIAGSLGGESSVSFDPARCLILEFRQAADWPRVASLCQGLQDDLELPLPAISVGAAGGYRLWFALAETMPLNQGQGFLDALAERYLAEISPANLRRYPDAEARPVELAPALDPVAGKWSAFIDPGLGEMFMIDGGLEMAPNPDRQADLLSRIKSLSSADLQRTIECLEAPPAPEQTTNDSAQTSPTHHAGSGYSDPQSFLLAVINDPTATTRDRIEAAKALLPYCFQPTAE